MRIKDVEYILCQMALPKPIPLSCGVLTHRNMGLIRIETDDGTVGWGETSINFPSWAYRERAATIQEGLAPLLVGERAHDVLRLRDKMVDATRPFTRMWSEGAIAQAISGIEIALWDILGKDLNKPVAELLGGVHRDIFRCYATGLRTDDPAEGALEAVAAGYNAIKIRVGFTDATDLANARAVRAAVGPDVALLIDANQAYDLHRARRMVGALSELNPYWIEEPVLSDDFEAQARLRQEFEYVPFAWGENAFRLDHYRQVARECLADIIMPDPCRCGGLGAAMDAARAVDGCGLPISAHHYGSDLGFAAMLHFMAAAKRVDLVLRDIAPVPLRDDIVEEDLRPVNGVVKLPSGPGLGITPNLDVIDKHRVRL